MRRLSLIAALFLSACVVVPGGPGRGHLPGVVVAPLLTVTALRLDPYALYRYDLTMPYSVRAGATVNVVRICYRWPDGAPVCVAPQRRRGAGHARVRLTHRHGRPQPLTGWVEYESGGRLHWSNEIQGMAAPR